MSAFLLSDNLATHFSAHFWSFTVQRASWPIANEFVQVEASFGLIKKLTDMNKIYAKFKAARVKQLVFGRLYKHQPYIKHRYLSNNLIIFKLRLLFGFQLKALKRKFIHKRSLFNKPAKSHDKSPKTVRTMDIQTSNDSLPLALIMLKYVMMIKRRCKCVCWVQCLISRDHWGVLDNFICVIKLYLSIKNTSQICADALFVC